MTKLEKSCYFAEDRISVSGISKKEYISTENMLQNKAGICEAANLPSTEYTASFQKNDVLVSNIRPYFKKIWYAKFSGGCSNDVLVFRAKGGFDSKFLYYVLSDDTFFNYVMSSAKGTKMPRGDKTAIMNYSVPDFDINIQRKIAGILGALDDKIEVLREQNKTLEQMAQAVFQSWFVDFDIVRAKAAGLPAADICKKYHITPDIYDLFPSAFSADNLPLGWEKKKLRDEFKITMGQSPSGDTYNEEKNGIPFFQGRRDFGFRYPMKRVYCTSPTRFAEKGDVLVSVRAPVGDLNIANFKCCIGRGVAAVHHYTDSTAYAFYHLKNLSNDFDVFNGDGTVFGCIGKDGFLNLNFISCPQETLVKLLPHLDLFENKIYENSKQIRTLEQTRDTLLPQLISGNIEV